MARSWKNNFSLQIEGFVVEREKGSPLSLCLELGIVAKGRGRDDPEANVRVAEAVVCARM